MSRSVAAVEALLASIAHPRIAEINLLRDIIRDVDPAIREEVKWNAPSFATTEHFATFHLRSRDEVQVVLHLGAKPRPDSGVRAGIDDPEKLLVWRGLDRATVTFTSVADIAARKSAFVGVVRQWLTFVA